MRKYNRFAAVLCAAVMIFNELPLSVVYAEPDEQDEMQSTEETVSYQEVHISSAQDLIDLSNKCSLDTWSVDKHVLIDDDINLSGTDFKSIPVFSGIFDGQGHTISGLFVYDSASYIGLFSKVSYSGVIKNVNIVGNIAPEGSQSYVAGIAGYNAGQILDCTFKGVVKGDNYTGAIVGYNETSGVINGCSSSGVVAGKTATGGIAGANDGTISWCTNNSKLNGDVVDEGISLTDISYEQYLAQITTGGSAGNDSNVTNSISDMGGIAGINTGMIFQCNNVGTIGYEHVGYNVGGIVGRQSGYINMCSNNGEVYGRKDVGGIVGQAEPYIAVDFERDIAYQLSQNITKLHNILDKTLTDAGNQSTAITNRVSVIKSFTDRALDDTSYLANQTEIKIDSTIEAANEAAGRIDYVVDEATKKDGVVDQSVSAAGNISDATSALSNLSDTANIYNYMTDAEKSDYDTAKQEIADANRAYAEYLDAGKNQDPPLEGDALTAYADAQFLAAYSSTYRAYTEARSTTMADIYGRHIAEMEEASKVYTDQAADSLEKAAKNTEEAAKQSKQILDDVSAREDITIPTLGSEYRDHTNSLINNIKAMSDNMGYLNSDMAAANTELINDLKAVNDQFNVIMELYADAVDGVLENDYSVTFEDKSLDVAYDCVDATIANSKNYGEIHGDINVSGIAGTMATEYDVDPESDITGIKDSRLNSTYETKCVLRGNINYKDVTGQKSYIGGICGLQELGTILTCDNYGEIVSNAGDYVGGVAGQSLGDIVKSNAKCTLKGGKYVGGIAGKIANTDGCYSIVQITEAKNFVGAIAGDRDENSVIKDNFFVSDTLAGIDRISYTNMAQPVEYDEMMQMEGVPLNFGYMDIRFYEDDDLVMKITKKYQDSLSLEEYPQLEIVEGYYTEWDIEGIDCITQDMHVVAESKRYKDVLGSKTLRDDKRTALLVEGDFMQEDVLDATLEVNETPKYGDWIEEWNVVIPKDFNQTHRFRYTAPEGVKNDKVVVYVESNGEWKKVDTDSFGDYITFEAEGDIVAIRIENKSIVLDLIVVLTICAALCTITIVAVRKKHKKKEKK